jgi:hypothetical protein
VAVVGVDGGAGRLAQGGQAADVVAMGVGDQDAPHVREGPPDGGQPGGDPRQRAAEAGVHHGQPVLALDDVDAADAQPLDGVDLIHHAVHPAAGS